MAINQRAPVFLLVCFFQRVNLEVKVENKGRKETVKTAARTPPVRVRVEVSQM